jgi:hypothetical protein
VVIAQQPTGSFEMNDASADNVRLLACSNTFSIMLFSRALLIPFLKRLVIAFIPLGNPATI